MNKVLAFTVPTGHRIVIRGIHGQAAAGTGVALLIYLGPGGPLLLRAPFPAGSDSTCNLEARIVLHEGEACYVRAIVANVDYSLHGYLLTGTGGPLFPGQLPAP